MSLRNNAERLLRDVRLTHGGMTARLDQVTTGNAPAPTERRSAPAHDEDAQPRERRRPSENGHGDDLDVPEFIPRG